MGKKYPLKVERIRELGGPGFMGVYSKGHHDAREFVETATREFSDKLHNPIESAYVEHEYWQDIPTDEGIYFKVAKKPTDNNAYPVTVFYA